MNDRLDDRLDLASGAARHDAVLVGRPFPPSLGALLEQCYENVFCTEARCAALPADAEVACYVAQRDGIPVMGVLYRREGRAITVLSEQFAIDGGALEQMVRCLFSRHQGVHLIHFPAVQAPRRRMPFPCQRYGATEDLVISLQGTPETYLASLGPNTRVAIRRAQRMLARQAPDLAFSFHGPDTIDPADVAALVELNCLRLRHKGQSPSHTADSLATLESMLGAYGCMLLARSGGRIRAGVACTHVGRHAYMHVIAHDPEFDQARLGLLCCFMSICESIRRGMREYHLLSGRYDYKRRLLGQLRDFDRIVVYRSLASVVASLPTYARTLVRGRGRQARQRMSSWRRSWTS
ncbi:CelD/BcsL family acetyltransferase involved in cellulose biosynthesis [Massilia sp. UYP11]|uniref:GNAT family N-acetyltransferase n=1 Tax=Massilia sp. UYP11 TaxID=1756385 RepID=UPI003D20CF60